MPIPVQAQQLARRLGTEVQYQPAFHGSTIDGVPIEPIRDPILAQRLGEYPDWREYEALWRWPEIFDPWRHLRAQLLSQPFEVQEGESGSRTAKVLADFARFLWGRLPSAQRPILLERLTDAEWLGWRPLQVIPEVATYKRREVLVPGRIVDKPAHLVRWTDEPEKRLVWIPGFSQQARIFDPVESRIGWMTPRTRTLDSSYGLGLGHFAWTLGKVIGAVTKKFYGAVDREWGMLELSLQAIPGEDLRAKLREVRDDLVTFYEYLNSNNTVLRDAKVQAQFIDRLEFIESGVELMKLLRTSMQTLIEGQTLTSDTKDSGPAGSSQTHKQVRTEYALMLACCTIEGAVEELFRSYIWLREGLRDPDPRDLPRFVSRLRLQLQPDTVRLMLEAGYTMKGRRLAQLVGPGAGEVVGTAEEIEADAGEFVIGGRVQPSLPGDSGMEPESVKEGTDAVAS